MEWAVAIMQAALDLKAGRPGYVDRLDRARSRLVFHVFPAKVEQQCEGGDFVDLCAQKPGPAGRRGKRRSASFSFTVAS
jgi:hypothetical protein